MPFGDMILLFYMQLKYSDNCFSKFDALATIKFTVFKLKKTKCVPTAPPLRISRMH